MNDLIIDYLVKEKNQSYENAVSLCEKVCKYEDIKNEFLKWLEKREYAFENALVIRGYKAIDIYSMANFLDGIGVYNFMVTLRDDPDFAEETIASGFKVK